MKHTLKVDFGAVAMVAACVCALAVTAAAGMLEQTMKEMAEYRELPKVKHSPDFRVEAFSRPEAQEAEGTDWWWIYDGKQKIGMIQTWTKEIEMFRFTLPPEGATVEYDIPDVHHFGTLVGAKINIYAPEFSAAHEPVVLEWIKKEGPVLEFKTFDKVKNGVEGDSIFHLSWDEKLGYVWD